VTSVIKKWYFLRYTSFLIFFLVNDDVLRAVNGTKRISIKMRIDQYICLLNITRVSKSYGSFKEYQKRELFSCFSTQQTVWLTFGTKINRWNIYSPNHHAHHKSHSERYLDEKFFRGLENTF